jgi:uncharacterized protein
MPSQVNCPVCSRAVGWVAESRWRPFCSERCKLIDLGDWAADRHVIAGDPLQADGDGTGSSQPEPENPRH